VPFRRRRRVLCVFSDGVAISVAPRTREEWRYASTRRC
jgi:hypothetical protein